jgi:hypothetical protein
MQSMQREEKTPRNRSLLGQMKLFPDPFPSSAIAGDQLSWLPSV